MPAPPPTGKRPIDSGLTLPARAHVPGSGTVPDGEPLEAAKTLAPPVTDARRWRANHAYLYGHELYRAGFHWEAHEVWEAVWLACRPNSPERLLLQALIARSNARLKQRMGQPGAAARLDVQVAGLERELLHRMAPGRRSLMGVKVAGLARRR